MQDAGDHAILIGRVLRFARHDGAGAPLVYFRGSYGALAQGGTRAERIVNFPICINRSLTQTAMLA